MSRLSSHSTHYDALVIGGGIAGLFTALELTRCGMQVAVLEQNQLGSGASGAGGGILSPLYPWRETEQLQALINYSRDHYPELVREIEEKSGRDIEYVQSGLLILDVADSEKESIHKWQANYHQDCEIIHSKFIPEWFPPVQHGKQSHIWLPVVAQVKPPRLIDALREYLNLLRVSIVEDLAAEEIDLTSRSIGVQTADGIINANNVVLTGGAWTSRLLPGLQVRPVRGQMLCVDGNQTGLQQIILRDGTYLIPRKDGRILIGSTLEETGFDNSVTDSARKALLDKGRSIFPAVADMPLVAHWAGLRPATQNGIPVISAVPDIAGLYVNTAHFRNGILFAAGSAKLIADLVQGHEPDIDTAPFAMNSLQLARSV